MILAAAAADRPAPFADATVLGAGTRHSRRRNDSEESGSPLLNDWYHRVSERSAAMRASNRNPKKPRRSGRAARTSAKLHSTPTSRPRSGGLVDSRRSSKPRSTHPPEGLDAADIIAVTLALARKVGFGRLSMRQIAAQLGVTATALYYHFHDKNELLDRVSGHIMDSIEIPAGRLPWSERLRQVVLNQQATLMAYPGLARFMVHYRESAGALRWIETILAVLHDAGFRDKEMTRALATLSFFIHPLTLVDDRPHPGLQQVYRRRRLAQRLQTDSSRYPCLTQLLPALIEAPYESYLPVALDGVIAGIAARLERSRQGAARTSVHR
jgi:AcrR family transcriptional regulator